jgi:hypothetical protein
MQLLHIHDKRLMWQQLYLVEEAEVETFKYNAWSALGCIMEKTPEIELIGSFATLADCVKYTMEKFPDQQVVYSEPQRNIEYLYEHVFP